MVRVILCVVVLYEGVWMHALQVSVVERLCEDTELREDFRLLGGVPLLLSLLG